MVTSMEAVGFIVKVAITGVSGFLGRALARALGADPAVESVLGLDLFPVEPLGDTFEFRQADVRTADFQSLLGGVDVLYHLAYVVDQPRGMKVPELEAINVEGSRRVFQGALGAGVNTLVFCSSVAVYGAHRDNPSGLTEAGPLRPNPDWHYARTKGEVEALLEALGRAHPGVTVITFRPSIVVGPGLPHLLGSNQTGHRILCFDPEQKVDFCGEADLVEAFRLALHHCQCDTFNLTADTPLSFREVGALVHQGLACPRRFWLRPLLKLGVRMGWLSEGDAQWLFPGSDGPILVSNARAKARLGWRPQQDCAAVLGQWVEQRLEPGHQPKGGHGG